MTDISLIGQPISRLDGPLKVEGQASFAAEFPIDGMSYAALAFSTIAKGRIATLDVGEAEAAPGVVLVMTHQNAPPMGPMPMMLGPGEPDWRAGGGDNLAVMQDDQVHWNGQPIAVVLAETQEQANYASTLIRASYEAQPAVTTLDEAKANGTAESSVFGHVHKVAVGDAEAALAAAAVSIDVTYRTPFQTHNAIEPHATTVVWDGDELVVHDANQVITHTAYSLAKIFGIEERSVHVTSPFVGGAFGGKALWQHQVLAAAAAKLAGRPVRMNLSREAVNRTIGGRTLTEQRVAIGAGADGRFDTLIHTGTTVTTQRGQLAEGFIGPSERSYAAGAFDLECRLAFQDIAPNSQLRAPGNAPGTYALECAVDELAVALGMDPIELRILNQPERNPTDGRPFSSHHAVEAWRAGAERFGWAKRNATPGAVRDGEWLVGMGCAASHLGYVRVPGGAARMTLTREGRARVEIAAHEFGAGTATALSQVVAERLGLAFEQVSFVYGDSTLPGLVMGGGSQQTASISASVIAAQHALTTELLQIAGDASPLAGLTADEVEGRDGGLASLDAPERHESYAAILARAGRDEIVVEAAAPPPQEMMDWSIQSMGAMFCELRVNAVTGEVRVDRVLGSMDCGRILNARTASSQFRGGVIMGLGAALMEETQFDERNGRVLNVSLAEQHVPVHMDVPEIDVIWTDIPDPQTPMGVHGLGEITITGATPAVANAIFNATGKRVRDLPITLDKLM